jgi:membrane carboxypeptidase/penicillin-binding protein
MPALPILRRRRERRIEQRQHKNSRFSGGLIGAGLTIFTILGLLIVTSVLAYASLTSDLPSLETIPALVEPPTGSLLQPTRIYDRTGEYLLAVLAPQDAPRRYLPLAPDAQEHLPDTLARATVALIDPGFWAHPGYSLGGLANPHSHPTIAQKLVADLVLWDEAPGLRRALRERILAAQLVSDYGREKVLEWYLNTAWYGCTAYGADSASQLYFGKSAAELNLAEATLLASVNQSPAINPLDAPLAALQRQQEALKVMQAAGLISEQEAELAQFSALIFQPDSTPVSPAPAFVALTLAQLETRFDRARVERGGMVVLTTLDYETQMRASCAVRTQLARLAEVESPACEGAASLPPLPPGLLADEASASAAVIDPRTGQILALVGDTKNGTESAFLTPHRPGTLLTPFIYLAGFTRGLSPATLAWDIPPPVSRSPAEAGSVSPTAIDAYRGPIRLRQAMLADLPIPTRQVFDGMGAALVGQTLRAFDFDVTAMSLDELLDVENRYTVLDIARAYGVFAAQGTLVGYEAPGGLSGLTLISIRGADGRDYANWNLPVSEQVVSAPLAYLVTDVLRDAAEFPIGRPAAAKTGLSSDGLDTWAVGYTPQRVVVVWLGGASGLSTRPAAGLSLAVMQAASRSASADDWPRPPGVIRLNVCDPSGLLPTPACPNIVTETFLDGYQPFQADSLYRTYAINRETGLLATVFTLPQLVENRVYLQVPPEAETWALAEGIESPPTTYDTIRAPRFDPFVNITAPTLFADVKGGVTITGTAEGQDFAYYRLQYGQGLNPSAWVLISESETPVSAGSLAEWDTSGLSGLYALQLVVVRADNRLEMATTQVTVDNESPQIGLDFPIEGAEISLAEHPQITFQPRVTDNLFVDSVEIWLDGRRLVSFTSPPFSTIWTARRGEHTLRIVARDRLGNETIREVKFTVK